MEVHVVATYGGVFGRLARWFGLKWSHAARRYVRDESAGARIIEAGACGVKEHYRSMRGYKRQESVLSLSSLLGWLGEQPAGYEPNQFVAA